MKNWFTILITSHDERKRNKENGRKKRERGEGKASEIYSSSPLEQSVLSLYLEAIDVARG